MELVENVFEIAESFMKNSSHVFLNHDKIYEVADKIKQEKKPVFDMPEIDNAYKAILLELVASSINYCYWYGRHDIRPNKANSTLMYETMLDAFSEFEEPDDNDFNECIDKFIIKLSLKRFPLLEERVCHLRQLQYGALDYVIEIDNRYTYGLGLVAGVNLEYLMNELISLFPGFGSDIFLKRASLFFIELYRRFGWFDDELHNLHVPADYQIPKMLEYFDCIKYSPSLKEKISNNVLIPKHSVEECEIRAATIIAMKELCEGTGWNVADVDTYFFTKRHLVNTPFHLTITTDY